MLSQINPVGVGFPLGQQKNARSVETLSSLVFWLSPAFLVLTNINYTGSIQSSSFQNLELGIIIGEILLLKPEPS